MTGVYIAGPMRGHHHFNFEAFFAADLVVDKRYVPTKVFNPAQRDQDNGFDPIGLDLDGTEDLASLGFDLDAAMKADDDFIKSDDCDIIVVLEGWPTSTGAVAEIDLGQQFGRRIIFLHGDEVRHYPTDTDEKTFGEVLKAVESGIPTMQAEEPVGYITKDSGEREEFSSGAKRDTQEGKPRYDLIPVAPLKRLAELYARGLEKYGENNWTKGMPVSRYVASAMRHLEQARSGDKTEDHWAAVIWNVMAVMHFEETSWNDLFDWEPTEAWTPIESEPLL